MKTEALQRIEGLLEKLEMARPRVELGTHGFSVKPPIIAQFAPKQPHHPTADVSDRGKHFLYTSSLTPGRDSTESVHPMSNPLQRYRLYIDESGDHVFRKLDSLNHRFLCLLGCWFRDDAYKEFHEKLENFKQKHIPHSPDEPVVLHREDILNRRRAFWRLRDPHRAEAFDTDLLSLIGDADFRVVAVVIDKKQLQHEYETPAHPYHLGLGFLLQRYCGYLNHVNRRGDVMAESRGGREDRLLKDSYSRVYERGIWMFRSEAVQRALTSKDLKVKPKSANIAGLQLADLLGHPVRLSILRDKAVTTDPPAPFASRLLEATQGKFNQHLYDGRVWGYGKVIFPDPEKKGPR